MTRLITRVYSLVDKNLQFIARMVVTAFSKTRNKQSRVNVQIFTMERGGKNVYGIPKNASGICLNQVFNENLKSLEEQRSL